MRRLVLFLMLALLLMSFSASAEEWSGFISGEIAGGSAVLHTSAHPSSPPITRLPEGELVLLLDAFGGWYYVLTPDNMLQGWIRRESFQFSEASAKEPRRGLILCEALTLREKPEANSARRTTLHTHQTVVILEELEGWYYVRLEDPNERVAGYVMKDFITADYTPRFIVDQSICAYAAPSIDSKKVALIDVGARIFIIDAYDEFWVISLRGASAFVSMRDLAIGY